MLERTRPKILIVDDSEMNRSMLSDMLSDGYDVLTAVDGQEAVDVLSSGPGAADLVLLDIIMPVLDGYGVLAYMEEWDLLGRIPVIVMSAAHEVEDIRRAYERGASEFLDKTFDQDVVRNRVGTVIRAFDASRRLEEERRRQRVYEELARVIKFEYDRKSDQVRLFPFGARTLSLPTVMASPFLDERLFSAMSEADMVAIGDMLHSTSPGNPRVYYRCKLRVGGEEKYYQASLEATWDGSSTPARYNGCVGTLIDIDVFEREAEKWSAKAQVDGLTGLLRHEYARQCIEQRMAERPDMKFLFVLFDLDRFKQANDTYGHEFGDQVLAHVGRTLRDTVRRGDILARVGGDEFIIFLEYSFGKEIVVQRVFDALCRRFGDKFDISVSMGAATTETAGHTYRDLFNAADGAMYAAKSAGRGRYVFHRIPDDLGK